MASTFELVTRSAIGEIIKEHCSESRYGLFLTEDDVGDLTDDLFRLIETSRNLKTAGDKFLSHQSVSRSSKA